MSPGINMDDRSWEPWPDQPNAERASRKRRYVLFAFVLPLYTSFGLAPFSGSGRAGRASGQTWPLGSLAA
jgi:hypothetical protein